MSFYQTYVDDFSQLLQKTSGIKHEISMSIHNKTCWDVYVIDMQNDFLPYGKCKVLGTEKLPAKINNFLHGLLQLRYQLEQKGYQIQIRLVMTRDYHPVDHTSFKTEDNPDGFPAHCLFGTHGSAIESTLRDFYFKFDTNINKLVKPDDRSIILFKGFHPSFESFGAIPYSDKYKAEDRQYTCLPTFQKYKDSEPVMSRGGAYSFPHRNGLDVNPFATGLEMRPETTKNSVDVNNTLTLNEMMDTKERFIPKYQKDVKYINFVMGLAGDFCVKDTMINLINGTANQTENIQNVLVFDLTSHVVIPKKDGRYDPKGQLLSSDNDKTDDERLDWLVPMEDVLKDYLNKSKCSYPPCFMTNGQILTFLGELS